MDALRTALGAACLVYGVVFGVAALLHAGVVVVPPGQPVNVWAAIVETLCAGAMFAGGHGALTRRRWAWDGLIYAHAAALSGVLLGILAVALGPGESTALLDWYHRSAAVLLALGLGGAFYVSRVRR
ncbi:hypothetical protein [Nonomuraea sp. SBT364]|uniref:hypothetical protein n=1 Tax=Nonomuraea sp. SBT364 TaxID=1580530 RepID=UPI00066C1E04|nr:hypothetical protein [Nonomuraea sp. SBT364]